MAIDTVKQVDYAQPIFKYPGGKRQLLPQLWAARPDHWHRYAEPFAGGAALYFRVAPERAYLSDQNLDVITVYQVVRDHLDALLADLQRHVNEEDYFYALRAQDPAELSPVERASRILALLRMCYSGVYRVNRLGQFNVPFGHYPHPDLIQATKLRAAHAVLQTTEIHLADFSRVVDFARPGDWLYLDPPYQKVSKTANFTAYTAQGFGWADQIRVAELMATLADRGCFVMASNADTPAVRDLYREWHIHPVMARRSVNADPARRAGAREVIVTTYLPASQVSDV